MGARTFLIAKRVLQLADIVVMGRYIQALRDTNLKWRGSTNQVVEFRTDRYNEIDMGGENQQFEVHIGKDGRVRILGYPDNDMVEKILGRAAKMNIDSTQADS